MVLSQKSERKYQGKKCTTVANPPERSPKRKINRSIDPSQWTDIIKCLQCARYSLGDEYIVVNKVKSLPSRNLYSNEGRKKISM